MNHILLITSSPRGAESLSTYLATQIGQGLHAWLCGPLTVRDLAANPLPHISSEYIQGRKVPPTARTPEQAKAVAIAQTPVIFNESVIMSVGREEGGLAVAIEQAMMSEARIAA